MQAVFLAFDLLQLTSLLYLTGGISNPFSILMIIPAIVSSTLLSMGTTIILGILTIIFFIWFDNFSSPITRNTRQQCDLPRTLPDWIFFGNYSWFNFFKLFWY